MADIETPTGVLLGTFTPGLCRCGCGQRTRIAAKTQTRLGHVKGQPLAYIHGHHQRVYRKPIDRTADRLRLLANVADGPPDACWEWTGGRTDKGYGKYFIDGRTVGAHRWAFIFAKGPIPDGQMVRHTCDNPPCCNPQHLLIGTHRQNVNDAIARDRTTRGTRNGRARLNAEQVRHIRARSAGGETGTDLAKAFGVHHNTIYCLLEGKTWGWLPQEELS
ncbi:HNH endonuclease [Streptomyces virginiae]|uniref:HNH endonuclease n=1 Tax=Streptomyces virginiae TaxID=1961 RepID=UPI002253569A|nr:HNH endonuclease [Streptomyces virginiae]MCX5176768.1 HNH endonuclease [Streptomyces virginiae]